MLRRSATLSWALVVAIGAAAQAQPRPARTVSYFYGVVKYGSPDGARAFGETTSLVERVVDPGAEQIDENVVQPGRRPGDPATEHRTHLARNGSTSTFSATDERKTFSGSLVFQGLEWRWNTWTYDLTLTDGGKITGDGALASDGITTHKRVHGKNGEATVLVTESLRPITAAKYVELKRVLLGR